LPDLAVRFGPWKLYCDYDGQNPALYNLDNDGSEKQNVAAENAGTVRQLTASVVEWNAKMPADNGPNLEALPKSKGKGKGKKGKQ
jgi:hypothetical protein